MLRKRDDRPRPHEEIAIVAAALDRCSSVMSGREEDIQVAEAALRDMESREASITLPCLGMLKAIEWVLPKVCAHQG